jgi:hypothetical protein
MSSDVTAIAAAVEPVEGTPEDPITIGERLRSTMAAEYATPFIAELNKLHSLVEMANAQRDAAERLAGSLAARVAAEHKRRLAAETELEGHDERLRRALAIFSYQPPAPPRRGERLRLAVSGFFGR